MITGVIIFFHSLLCLALVVVVLMQSGRGGGLTEGFASAESMFGAKTNELMIKATTFLASFFLVTSLALAYISSQKETSLIGDNMIMEEVTLPDMELPQDAPGDTDEAGEASPAVESPADSNP